MACIIYWQAKEISRVIQECNLQDAKIDITVNVSVIVNFIG